MGDQITYYPKSIWMAFVGLIGIMVAAATLPVPVWAQMLPSTALIIFIGSMKTIVKGSDATLTEQMTTSDAYKFPLIGSAVLFTLYAAFKLLPTEWITFVVKSYFFIFGVLVVGVQVSQAIGQLLAESTAKSLSATVITFKVPAFFASKPKETATAVAASAAATTATEATTTETTAATVKSNGDATAAGVAESKGDDDVKLSKLDLAGFAVSLCIGIWYIATNHWAANNVLGIAFSIQGIESIGLGSYFNGFILLCGLFVYDIFWVFGTNVMVTVAKSFDGPIKLLFPQTGLDSAGAPLRPSLLGLGDIVIPGIYIALLLRFDIYLYRKALAAKHAKAAAATATPAPTANATTVHAHEVEVDESKAPVPYFTSVMIFYVVGLIATLGVMYYFKAAQPALLYLVPACLLSAFTTAIRRGEVQTLWKYEETEEAAKEKAN